MAFVFKQNNRLQSEPQQQNRAFGRGLFANQDLDKADKKNKQQILYKQQLEQQMKEKEDKKKRQKQLIQKEDERFIKQIQQINKKDKEFKEKQKKNDRGGHQIAGFNPTYDDHTKRSNNPTKGSLQVNIKSGNSNAPQMNFQQIKNRQTQFAHSLSPTKNYEKQTHTKQFTLFERDPMHEYYDDRMRKHKESLDRKLDELFSHIHSTQDNVRVDEELEKIRMRLRGKQNLLREGLKDMSDSGNYNQNFQKNDSHFEEFSKFYKVPKKVSYGSPESKSRVRKLDYQSSSAFKSNDHSRMRNKVRTQLEQYSQIPKPSSQSRYRTKWGKQAENQKFLSGRDALDFQIKSSQDRIDELLNKLSHNG